MSSEIWNNNRVILSHFDSYSAALLFARWDNTTLLSPEGLHASVQPMTPPETIAPQFVGQAVLETAIEKYGINPKEITREAEFDEWMQTETGPVRIHLLRFKTFEAPHQLCSNHGGQFKAISMLRGSDMRELKLLKRAFDLIVGAERGTARG